MLPNSGQISITFKTYLYESEKLMMECNAKVSERTTIFFFFSFKRQQMSERTQSMRSDTSRKNCQLLWP